MKTNAYENKQLFYKLLFLKKNNHPFLIKKKIKKNYKI